MSILCSRLFKQAYNYQIYRIENKIKWFPNGQQACDYNSTDLIRKHRCIGDDCETCLTDCRLLATILDGWSSVGDDGCLIRERVKLLLSSLVGEFGSFCCSDSFVSTNTQPHLLSSAFIHRLGLLGLLETTGKRSFISKRLNSAGMAKYFDMNDWSCIMIHDTWLNSVFFYLFKSNSSRTQISVHTFALSRNSCDKSCLADGRSFGFLFKHSAIKSLENKKKADFRIFFDINKLPNQIEVSNVWCVKTINLPEDTTVYFILVFFLFTNI